MSTSDDEGTLIKEVSDWIHRQGYPLEMTIARAFQAAEPFFVKQGEHYIDSKQGTAREIDVCVNWCGPQSPIGESRGVGIFFTIESKNTTSPWIIFTEDEKHSHYWIGDGLTSTPRHNLLPSEHDAIVLQISDYGSALLQNTPGYNIVEKRTEHKGGTDKAYDSVRQAAAGAVGYSELVKGSVFRNQDTGEYEPLPIYCFPAVVTQSPLFLCRLADDGSLLVDKVDIASVYVTPDPESGSIIVEVVNSTKIDRFVNLCKDLVYAMMEPPVEQRPY